MPHGFVVAREDPKIARNNKIRIDLSYFSSGDRRNLFSRREMDT